VKISNKHFERLQQFEKASKLKKAALSFLASRVQDRDIEKEMEIFKMLDKNKDGYVTLKELKEGLKENPNIEEIARLLEGIDMDKNGAINYSEFIAATMNVDNMMKNGGKIQDAFSAFDKDGDGKITREELM